MILMHLPYTLTRRSLSNAGFQSGVSVVDGYDWMNTMSYSGGSASFSWTTKSMPLFFEADSADCFVSMIAEGL